MNKNRKSNHSAEARDLADRAYDLWGEMLLQRETDAMLAEIEAEKANGGTRETDAFWARSDTKNRTAINRYFHGRQARTFIRQTLPKVGKIAAILIAICTVTVGVAMAASHTVRVQVMKLLTNMETQYTELKLVEDPAASFDVPAEWMGEYYPAYIPDGLALDTVHAAPGDNTVEYRNRETGNIQLNFMEAGDSTESNVDTENSIVQDVTINGNAGFLSEKQNRFILCWSNGKVYFILIVKDMDQATVMKIAESVARIQ